MVCITKKRSLSKSQTENWEVWFLLTPTLTLHLLMAATKCGCKGMDMVSRSTQLVCVV